ncbi:PspC domain-containing protein [Aeromicrobium sp.]|uniref:PspC domain-containing protein n=1 Tax=Aeromicrobium sp. TaxID=1871063 RepID=UPI0030BB17AC
MNAEDTRTTPPDGDFDPQRLRSITDMRRSRDDRLLGGVCSGAAKYLNIDPVIVRVVIAVLTVVGFAGVILYAAAWFLLPAADEDKSVAADWFKLDKNEEQVRVIGLVGAVVVAGLAVIGDNGYFWDGAPWILVPIAFVYYLFFVRPRRRRSDDAARQAAGQQTVSAADGARVGLVDNRKYAKTPRDRSWTLTGLTASVAVIAVAATRIYAEYHDETRWTSYVAVALGVVAIGLLVGTLFGNGGPLIGLGVILAIALAIGSVLPNGKFGEQRPVPLTASQVDSTYRHGIGLLELDLTQVQNQEALIGDTINLRAGVGQTKVIVPSDLDVTVVSHLGAGEISIFGRKVNGTDNDLDLPATTGPALMIDIDQRFGNIEVIRR